MTETGLPEDVEVLARRVDLIAELSDEPLHKADLVERMEYSRSTVDRAVRELEAAGYVERVTRGYVATQAGQLSAERFRAFLDQQRSILGAADVLSAIPHDDEVPLAVVTEAEVETDDPAYRLFERLAAELAAADSVRMLLPALPDSRHLRLWHDRVVRDDLAVVLQAPEAVLEDAAREFPYLWAELAEAPGFLARPGPAPPFALALASEAGAVRSVIVAATDDGEVSGMLYGRGDRIAAWGEGRYASMATDTEDVTGEVRPETPATEFAPLTGDRLPPKLRSEGFVRVDDRYFERREPMDPETAWRVGLDLPEVAAGYAVDRVTRDAGTGDGARGGTGETGSLTTDLVDRLRGGEDVVLVGPPGSGKSTVCKSVACAWQRDGDGTVLYRESGGSQPFESTARLEKLLERTTDDVLVVVEDAVRPEANAVFEVVQAFEGHERVRFLLDARESEYRDPEEFPVDARLRALRRRVETVRVPPFDGPDPDRLVDHVESVTDTRLDVDARQLLDEVRRTGDDDAGTPGVLTLFCHRLVRYLDPVGRTGGTTLDEDVDRVHEDLAGIGETALDVGLLVNALNAAGIGVAPAYVYAVAVDDGTFEDVEAALERLRGHVVFPPTDSTDTAFRTVHETWSARYLERRLEADPAEATRRFGRCLTAVLSLADDPDRREAVTRAVGGRGAALDPVVTDRTGWADETVASLFALGRTYPKLARLFGTGEGSSIALPEACSAETRVRTAEWRGEMYAATEALDRADREFRRLESAAETLSAPTGDRVRTRALLGRSNVALRRGELDAAAEFARDGLELAEASDERRLRSRALRRLGEIAKSRGEFERAREHLRESLEIERSVGDRHGRARTAEKLGTAAMKHGDLEPAREHLERALELYRETDDLSGEADCLTTLGAVEMKRNDLSLARTYLRQGLDIQREVGDRYSQSATLSNLGLCAMRAGDFDDARQYFEECLAIDREVGNRRGEAQSLNCLGELSQWMGDLASAKEYIERCLTVYRDIGDRHGEALAVGSLGSIARQEGNLETARERHEESLELKREIGDRQNEAGSHNNLGVVAREQGDHETARQHHRRAVEIQREREDRHGEAFSLVFLGRVAQAEGDLEAARERYREAIEVATDAGVGVARGRANRHLGQIAHRKGDLDEAADRYETAVSSFEDGDVIDDELAARADMVELALERGRDDRARRHYGLAVDRLEAVEAVPEDTRERIESLEAAVDPPQADR